MLNDETFKEELILTLLFNILLDDTYKQELKDTLKIEYEDTYKDDLIVKLLRILTEETFKLDFIETLFLNILYDETYKDDFIVVISYNIAVEEINKDEFIEILLVSIIKLVLLLNLLVKYFDNVLNVINWLLSDGYISLIIIGDEYKLIVPDIFNEEFIEVLLLNILKSDIYNDEFIEVIPLKILYELLLIIYKDEMIDTEPFNIVLSKTFKVEFIKVGPEIFNDDKHVASLL